MDLFNTRLALPTMCRTSSALLQSRLHGSPIRRSAQVKLLPRMICMDGFSLSVQASETHGCKPQRRDGPYSHVECACPSEPVPALMPYLLEEEGVSPVQSVYRCVPVEVVQAVLTSHGGLRD
ncbi:hypothetical protein [Paracoccus sp. T5]|uniref:hypothetical protein n=1 Tax=Paracoccus sp. T5 TaxID=3402161 RepID=UPI003ADA69EE